VSRCHVPPGSQCNRWTFMGTRTFMSLRRIGRMSATQDATGGVNSGSFEIDRLGEDRLLKIN
jgi:hypothetical protein